MNTSGAGNVTMRCGDEWRWKENTYIHTIALRVNHINNDMIVMRTDESILTFSDSNISNHFTKG